MTRSVARVISLWSRPGENIPVDGIVLEGSSAVNESALDRREHPGG